MFTNTRRKIASKLGRIEHRAGRIISLPIITGLLINLYNQENLNTILWGFTFITWIVYLTAHTLEKKFYGRVGFR